MLQIVPVTAEGEKMEEIRSLFREYEQELGENLCFQSFEQELADPLKKYGPPRGALYLAMWKDAPAGCIALMPLQEQGVCEMKRLYVRPAYRRHHIGHALVNQLLQQATALGYHTMKLDTLRKLQPAIALYKRCGFTATTAYYSNPLEGVVYMEKVL